MAIEESTPNQNYPLPNGENYLAEDVARLRTALTQLDSDIANLSAQIAAKAPVASPAFTGVPTVPTADAGDNSTQAANTAFVANEIATGAVTLSGVQDVANKNLLTNNRIVDAADHTKKLAHNISGFSTATTRTVTWPDADIDIGALSAKYAFRRGNILGTVSQSGGTPTGALVENGSNSNGTYVRFADGTQICRAALTLNNDTTSRCSVAWTLPAAFVDANFRVNAEYKPSSGASSPTTVFSDAAPTTREILAPVHGAKTTTSVTIMSFTITGATAFGAGDHLYVDVIAIGKWF